MTLSMFSWAVIAVCAPVLAVQVIVEAIARGWL